MLAQLVTTPQPDRTSSGPEELHLVRERAAGGVQPGSHSDDALRTDAFAAGQGDRAAFHRLYTAQVQRVFSLVARMVGNQSEAEELVQDVFVRAWQKLPTFRGESAFGTWLHRLAVNVVLSHRKADAIRRERHVDEVMLDLAHAKSGTVGDRMDLEQAIAQLPPGARRVFVLHDVEGFTHEEIGAQLGITPGGSKAQLHRARQLLREALNR